MAKLQNLKVIKFFFKKFQRNGMVNVAAQAPAANQRLSMACMTKINNVVEA